MTALSRSGRPIEALLSYQHYETKLAAWQTQPGAAIAQTAQAIKDGDYTIRRPLASTRLDAVTATTV